MNSKTTPKYRWNNPHEWLLEKRWTKKELYHTLEAIAYRLDADSIQDLFQDEMKADGYFKKGRRGR